ncbi:antibiotic biosynthesis monooxygenase [Pseudomaricurvus alcaniphilus]|uniref:putative quinol monooxygenase n=1 Tax=Pseudomaricurvus alcaniphilus TaxID=1166482 RepID=UPI00140CB330|nr:putative quinol monooxygenase [Pseudomaricurvus alcaniphilus]NHN39255.1 antibiotic biosynthesis monooxygenase [Pseudomaricurvus alcaniphilus]
MLVISARVEVAPADAEAYIAGAQKIIEPTRAEQGCQLYGLARDISEPNVVWISEQWDSEADLFAHLKTPHIAEFLELTSALTVIDMNAIRYDVAAAGPLQIPQD